MTHRPIPQPVSNLDLVLYITQKYIKFSLKIILTSRASVMKNYARIFWMVAIYCTASLLGDEFSYEPPKNFTLNPKFIGLHHPVTTNQILAQLYFDQGLTFIYAFNHEAAYWSFFKASEADPDMAMAYWGMAQALGTNINLEITPERAKKAYDLIQKGKMLMPHSSEVEQDYIQALAQRYSNDPKADGYNLAHKYSQAMQLLSKKYPDDLDAAVLFAESILNLNPWNQWGIEGKPHERTIDAVKKLESVLSKDPEHLGANHYYIHAIEASPHPERALYPPSVSQNYCLVQGTLSICLRIFFY